MLMFVYLFFFIVMFQPDYCNFFYFSFPPQLARLFCGQGSIIVGIQKVFNKLKLKFETRRS